MGISNNIEKVKKLVQISENEEALKLIKELKENEEINDDIYYEEANIYVKLKKYDKAKEICNLGLQYNPMQSRFYSVLGEIYSDTRKFDNAYISYRQAEAFSKKEKDDINSLKNISCASKINANVKKVSVIIFSKDDYEHTKITLDSLEKFNDDDFEVIVINYKSDDGRYALLEVDDKVKVLNIKDKNILAAYNDALMEIGYDRDVLILDSRTVILPGSIFTLRMALYNNDDTAIASSVSNNAALEQYKDVNCGNFNDFAYFASKNNIVCESLHKEVREVELFSSIIRGEFLLGIGLFNEKYIEVKDGKVYFKLADNEYKSIVCPDSFVYRIL